MSDPSGSPRASRAVKLVLMGVAGAAVLYACAPGAAGLGGMPYIFFLPNPFFRGPVSAPGPPLAPWGSSASPGGALAPGADAAKASPSQAAPSPSQRGGFGATGGSSGSSGAS